jgi:hypothetical protein
MHDSRFPCSTSTWQNLSEGLHCHSPPTSRPYQFQANSDQDDVIRMETTDVANVVVETLSFSKHKAACSLSNYYTSSALSAFRDIKFLWWRTASVACVLWLFHFSFLWHTLRLILTGKCASSSWRSCCSLWQPYLDISGGTTFVIHNWEFHIRNHRGEEILKSSLQ